MAPTAALFFAHPIAPELLDDIPAWAREDPDIRAVLYCHAKEAELRRAKIEEVRRQFFPPTADVALSAWEATFRLTVEPVGLSIADRRAIVGEAFLRALSTGTGADWEDALTRLVGPGVTYEEDDPQVPSNTVPAYTVRVTLPFAPTSDTYMRIERALRIITPANTDLILQSGAGFVLDVSQLDQESFGGN